MARLTLLLTLVALALPSAALAASGPDPLASERYYQSFGTNPAPALTAVPEVSSGHSGPSWLGAAALGAALVLLAGGVGAYGARSLGTHRVRA